MKNLKPRYFLLLLFILILAGVLRFYQLGWADVINDEVIFAFRSIGYIDFFSSPYQTTPWEWFSEIPIWAHFSFHDAPPLVFLIQHLFFILFGQSILVLRLPFVLAGIASIYLLYLIGKQIFNSQVGIIASLLLAVSSYHVWISRTGLQESIVIFLSLLAFYLFLQAQETNRYWLWGICLGLAMLAKYTAFILLPIFVVHLLFFQRSVFKDKRFWLGVILIFVVFSPVIIYNLKLYQTRGHFDLQFSYLFKQDVSEWKSLPGKEQIGSFNNRLVNLIPALYQGMLWPTFILFIAGLLFIIYKLIKKENLKVTAFLLILAIFFYLTFFLLIGPTKRFIVMVVPFILLLVAYLIFYVPKYLRSAIIILLVVIEIFFSYNTLLTHYPKGMVGITYSYLNIESYNYGYNQLNNYLVQLLKDKYPEMTFQTKYQFLEDIKKQSLERAKKQNKKSAAILLIYDNNMYDLATFWLFHRRLVYEGWPIITADDYSKQVKEFWLDQRIKDFYFIKILDNKILLRPDLEQTRAAQILVDQIDSPKPEIIKRPDGREVFAVYHWQ